MIEKCQLFYFNSKIRKTIFCFSGGVIETRDEKPIYWLRQWCLENGSTLDGRLASCRYMIRIVQKPPILVSEKNKIVFLPIASCFSEDCIFIQYSEVSLITEGILGETIIEMKDQSKYTLPVGRKTIKQQYKRATELLRKLQLLNQKFVILEVNEEE